MMAISSSPRRDGPPPSPSPSPLRAPRTQLPAGLQELTRRLQEERDTLRESVEELTRQLHVARNDHASAVHEIETKELELVHEQQRSRQAKQGLRDKIMQLEKELDEERAQHQLALLGRNVAADKNATLAAELKEIEVKYKKEVAKREDLALELEQLREEMQHVALEREQIIQVTESDAKRVRALWEQITREHATHAETLRVELEGEMEAKAELEARVEEDQHRIKELETRVAALIEEKSALEVKIEQTSNETHKTRQYLEREREREMRSGQQRSDLQLEIQDLKSRCVVLEEREKIAVRERDLATTALQKAEAALEAKVEEHLALKTEFSDLLDKHERQTAEIKQRTREREANVRLRLEKLEQRRSCAEELAAIRQKEIKDYKHVLRSVNRRLNETREKQQTLATNKWTVDPHPRQRKSVNINRH